MLTGQSGGELMIRRTNTIFLAALLTTMTSLPAEAQNAGCRTKPKSGMGGFLQGLADRASRRLGGTGVLGDVILEGRKLLSDTIACALTDVENKQALDTQRQALESGKTGQASRRQWTSGERPGVNGGTEVVSRRVSSGVNCAVQRTFITDADGKEQAVDREVCQGGDGKWAVA